MDPAVIVRTAVPADYDPIIAVVDTWWGRPVRQVLPRLFLDHFFRTSLIAEGDGQLAGFLIGFCSPSLPDEAYIHFLGVAPDQRRHGLADLYREFFDLARADGRTHVRAVTSPINSPSITFHQRLGFTVTSPNPHQPNDVHVHFHRQL